MDAFIEKECISQIILEQKLIYIDCVENTNRQLHPAYH